MSVKKFSVGAVATALSLSVCAASVPPVDFRVALVGEVPEQREFLNVVPSVDTSSALPVDFSRAEVQPIVSFAINSSLEKVVVHVRHQNPTNEKGTSSHFVHHEDSAYYFPANVLIKIGSPPTWTDMMVGNRWRKVMKTGETEKFYFSIRPSGAKSHDVMKAGIYGGDFSVIFEPMPIH